MTNGKFSTILAANLVNTSHFRLTLNRLLAAILLLSVGLLISMSFILPYFAQHEATRLRALRYQTGRLVGSGLAFHAGSRWLRHPESSEPWAAFQDGPSMIDTDPAGAWTNPVPSAQSHAVATHARLIQHGAGR